MILAARESFTTASSRAAGWKNPYVADGLVAMWDGEWNAGGGVHDAAATKWKDLIGNHDMEFVTPSAVSVLDNAMQFVASFSQSTERAMRATAPSSVVMVDMCFSCVSGFTVNQNIFLGPTSSGGGNLLTVIAANRNRGFVCTKGPILGPGESDIGSCTIATTGAAGWKNGVALAQGADNGSLYTNDGYVTLCAGTSQNFKIHSLRIYSRVLTAAPELAANYTIDRERFNLP